MKKIFTIILVLIVSTCMIFSTSCAQKPSTSLSKADYARALSSVSSRYYSYYDNLELPSPFSITFGDEDYHNADSMGHNMCYSVMWFVDFMKNVLNNPQFALTTGYTECDVTDLKTLQQFLVRFSLSFDESTGAIISEMYAKENDAHNAICYVLFNVDYDFKQNELKSFVASYYTKSNNPDNETFESFKFINDCLLTAKHNTEAFSGFMQDIRNDATTHIEMTWSDNRADYSEEYSSARPSSTL